MEHKLKKTDDCYVCENCRVASGDGDGVFNFLDKKRPCLGQKLGFTDYTMDDDGNIGGTLYTFDIELKNDMPVAVGGGREFDIEDLMKEKGASLLEEELLTANK